MSLPTEDYLSPENTDNVRTLTTVCSIASNFEEFFKYQKREAIPLQLMNMSAYGIYQFTLYRS